MIVYQRKPTSRSRVLAAAAKQHGRISRSQLLALGVHPQTIKAWLTAEFLFIEFRGVYAVGRRDASRYGKWLAAVLSCGPQAVLYRDDAAALWGICPKRHNGPIDVLVPGTGGRKKRDGIDVHRSRTPRRVTRTHGIPVTTPIDTLIDIAPGKDRKRLESAINNADNLGLVKEPRLRAELEHHKGRPGVPALKAILDPATFVLTDTELERRFYRLARRAGLPKPHTQRHFGSDRVDFWWDFGLVVEVDSVTYHRTTIQQAVDRARDHRHYLADREPLRVTYYQIVHDEDHVVALLVHAAAKLQRAV